MNRRHFLAMLSGSIAGIALEQAVPFGRVYSFPSVIKTLNVMPVTELLPDDVFYPAPLIAWLLRQKSYREAADRMRMAMFQGHERRSEVV